MTAIGARQSDRKGKNGLSLWFIVLMFPLFASVARAEVDFETVVEALEGYEQKLSTVCFTGKYQGRIETDHDRDTNYARDNESRLTEFAIDLGNRRWRYDERYSFNYGKYSKEPFEVRNVRSFDGQHGYWLRYTYRQEPTGTGLPPEMPFKLRFGRLSSVPPGILHPLGLAGLGIEPSHGWPSLLNRLQTEPCTWEGSDRVMGVDCYKISIRPPAVHPRLLTFWLDPAHDFLPLRREIQVLDDGGLQDKIGFWVETTDFEQFPLPDGERIWFPARARSEQSVGNGKFTFELLDLSFHNECPVEQFRIDPVTLSSGTLITDQSKNTSYHLGGAEGKSLHEEWQRLEDAVDKRLEEKLGPRPTSGPPTAKRMPKPTETNAESDSLWLYTNLCLLALLGCVWIFYQVRKSRIRKTG